MKNTREAFRVIKKLETWLSTWDQGGISRQEDSWLGDSWLKYFSKYQGQTLENSTMLRMSLGMLQGRNTPTMKSSILELEAGFLKVQFGISST